MIQVSFEMVGFRLRVGRVTQEAVKDMCTILEMSPPVFYSVQTSRIGKVCEIQGFTRKYADVDYNGTRVNRIAHKLSGIF